MIAFLGRDIVYCLDTVQMHRLYGEADVFTREVYLAGMRDTISTDSAVNWYRSRSVLEPGNPIWPNNIGATANKAVPHLD